MLSRVLGAVDFTEDALGLSDRNTMSPYFSFSRCQPLNSNVIINFIRCHHDPNDAQLQKTDCAISRRHGLHSTRKSLVGRNWLRRTTQDESIIRI
jgi:hypothetical protein